VDVDETGADNQPIRIYSDRTFCLGAFTQSRNLGIVDHHIKPLAGRASSVSNGSPFYQYVMQRSFPPRLQGLSGPDLRNPNLLI
jgi:hypothetical protein